MAKFPDIPNEPAGGDGSDPQPGGGTIGDHWRLETPRTDSGAGPAVEATAATDRPAETLGELLAGATDAVFGKYPDRVKENFREFEEQLVLDAGATFSECPTATRLIVTRPVPGQETAAAERWKESAGVSVTVHESLGLGHIQTRFLVAGDEVIQRQMVHNPGDSSPLPGESAGEAAVRRAKEILGDTLSLSALSPEVRAAAIRKQEYGEPARPEVVAELAAWIGTATPADLRY